MLSSISLDRLTDENYTPATKCKDVNKDCKDGKDCKDDIQATPPFGDDDNMGW